jgi:hypothetical protein
MTAAVSLTPEQLASLRKIIRRWPDLRILTVRQPWADLVMAGVKDVENRSWRVPPSAWPLDDQTGLRLRGPLTLGIHAAAKIDRDADPETWAVYPVDWNKGRELPEMYALGALLGTVSVTGCHHADECHGEWPVGHGPMVKDRWCSRWAEPYRFHWMLSDPEPLDVPVPMKGMLGLWHLPELALTAEEQT